MCDPITHDSGRRVYSAESDSRKGEHPLRANEGATAQENRRSVGNKKMLGPLTLPSIGSVEDVFRRRGFFNLWHPNYATFPASVIEKSQQSFFGLHSIAAFVQSVSGYFGVHRELDLFESNISGHRRDRYSLAVDRAWRGGGQEERSIVCERWMKKPRPRPRRRPFFFVTAPCARLRLFSDRFVSVAG